MIDRALTLDLFDAGLLQFGRFVTPDGVRPFQHHLTMLASYPDLLRRVGQGLAEQASGVDRLLCSADCTPLAVAVSLEKGLPLVIGRGGGADGARDFVGAYDIGHPVGLIVHAQDEANAALTYHAGRFGLEVRCVLAVLDGGLPVLPAPAFALLNLRVIVSTLSAEGRIPGPLGDAVLDWLKGRTIPRRPG